MNKILIPRHGTVSYVTQRQACISPSSPYSNMYRELYNLAAPISNLLKIKCPVFSLEKDEPEKWKARGLISAAITYNPKDILRLYNAISLLKIRNFLIVVFQANIYYGTWLTGLVAHELRHVWQQTYHIDIYNKHASSYDDALFNLSEIDADAFAIWYLSVVKDCSLAQALSLYCLDMKNILACTERIIRAKEIAALYSRTYYS